LETKGFIIEGLPTTKGVDNNWCLDVALSVCERKGERKRKGGGGVYVLRKRKGFIIEGLPTTKGADGGERGRIKKSKKKLTPG
jgi:hypothetical protein